MTSSFRRVATVIACMLMALLLPGCATSTGAPVGLASLGIKRVAIASPAKMHRGLFLNWIGDQVPAHAAYRQFCDVLKADLEAKGIVVIDYCSRPNTTVIMAGQIFPVPRLAKNEADAILVPDIALGFFAYTKLNDFRVTAHGSFVLINTKTNQPVAGETSVFSVSLDPPAPSYFTADELVAHLAEAQSSLDRAAAALAKNMGAAIRP